jgi:Zn-dependent protease with chaperone function
VTFYVLIGLAWLLVGVTVLGLRLVGEREPERQWRLLLGAAAAPFLLSPVASVCRTLFAKAVAVFPLLDSLWPLAALTAVGAVAGLVRIVVVMRRQRALLAACRAPEGDTAVRLKRPMRRVSRVAGLREAPRVLLYPRGAYVGTLGLRRPLVVISRSLLRVLDDDELEAVLSHEVAHVRQRDYLLNWVGLVARPMLFYLPPWAVAWPVLAEVRERRADRAAAGYTGKPLALAAALIKVWQHRPEPLATAAAVGLLQPAGRLEARVRRLLDPPPRRPFWRASVSAGLLVGGFLVVQTTVEGATHALARVHPEVAALEECCDLEVSLVPHCVPSRRVFFAERTIACSRMPERGLAWTS